MGKKEEQLPLRKCEVVGESDRNRETKDNNKTLAATAYCSYQKPQIFIYIYLYLYIYVPPQLIFIQHHFNYFITIYFILLNKSLK